MCIRDSAWAGRAPCRTPPERLDRTRRQTAGPRRRSADGCTGDSRPCLLLLVTLLAATAIGYAGAVVVLFLILIVLVLFVVAGGIGAMGGAASMARRESNAELDTENFIGFSVVIYLD